MRTCTVSEVGQFVLPVLSGLVGGGVAGGIIGFRVGSKLYEFRDTTQKNAGLVVSFIASYFVGDTTNVLPPRSTFARKMAFDGAVLGTVIGAVTWMVNQFAQDYFTTCSY